MIKSFLTPLLFLGLAIGIVFMYTLPQYEAVKRKLVEKATYENALSQGQEILRLKASLAERYQMFSPEDRLKLQKMLPDRENLIGAIIETDNIATENGVVLTAISDADQAASRADTAGQDSPGTVNLSFDVVSDYGNFLTFLKALERSLRITDLDALSFSVAEDGSNLMNFSLGAKTYWLGE